MTRFSITHTNPVPVPVAVTTDTKFVEPRGANWNLESTSEATDKERRATLRRRCVVWPTPRSPPRFRQGRSPPSCYYAGHQLNLRLVATHCDLSAMWSDRNMQQLLSPSSLDAAVITAASSDFCVPFGGRLLCTSRRIYFRVASPAVTSVGIFSVYVHFTPRPPHPSAPGSPIHWHLSKTNPTGSPVFTASHMIRGRGRPRDVHLRFLYNPQLD